MALDLHPGDEIIVPSFTYVATAEVICLLGFKPVMVDVDAKSFNLSISNIKSAITSKTRVIVPVHLFGQCVNMEPILELAEEMGIHIVEDAAQAIGAKYTFKNGVKKHAGTIGVIGCTSFFPSKNLGAFGDGGAIFTCDSALAVKLKMIANHGQKMKYIHKYVGVNSRLDTIQAAILDIKLKHLDSYIKSRLDAADFYDKLLFNITGINIPYRSPNSTHVFHQYTIIVEDGYRDKLKDYLTENGVPSMVYYPKSLSEQEAFMKIGFVAEPLIETKKLCSSVLSLPMHTELSEDQQIFIAEKIRSFFKPNLL